MDYEYWEEDKEVEQEMRKKYGKKLFEPTKETKQEKKRREEEEKAMNKMRENEEETEEMCDECGELMTYMCVGSDADGNRQEWSFVCPECG